MTEVRAQLGAPLGIHAHNDAGCAVASTLVRGRGGRMAGAGRRERLRGAHRQRRPDPDRRRPRAQDGARVPARGLDGAAHRGGALRRRGGEPGAGPAPALRGALRLHPQGRTACERRGEIHRGLRAHRARHGRQPPRHRCERSRRLGDAQDEGRRIRPRAPRRVDPRPARGTEGARVDRLHLRDGRRLARDPHAARRAGGASRSSRSRASACTWRSAADEEALAEATVKVVTKGTRHIESAEGAGPVGRARQRPAQGAHERLPRARSHDARGLPRAHPLRECGNRRRGSGAHRHVQRRAGVDHRRREREHHRGQLGSAHRRLPVRPAPPPRGSLGLVRARRSRRDSLA